MSINVTVRTEPHSPQGQKLPRDITAEETIKAFVKAGGVLRGGKGSHVNIKMPSGMIITLPSKGRLKTGLLRAAIRKANLTVEEFLRLLRR